MARPAFKNKRRNPYNFLLYSALQRCGVDVREYASSALLSSPWDILHVHWPESLLETGSYLSARWSEGKYLFILDFVRRRGTRVVWTVHDLKPHDLVYPELETRFWAAVLERLDGIIALTQSGLTRAVEGFPRLQSLPAFVIPHGHYRGQYRNDLSRDEARQRLGLAEHSRVITYFGQIRPYKNVPRLIECVRRGDDDVVLLVCGRLSKRANLETELRSAAGEDPRIRLLLEFIADDDVQQYLIAADLLVFPYKDILNSGSALLGLSFDRPILVPNRGAMQELQNIVGSDWVRTYDGDLDEAAIRDALAWAAAPRGSRPQLHAFDWDVIGQQTLAAFQQICGGPAGSGAVDAA